MPRSLGLVNRLLPPCMLPTPPLGVSCSSSFCSSGRKTYPVSTSLGEVHHRCVGFVSNSRGIGSCVSGTPSFVGQSDSYVSDLRQREVPSSVRGSSISITEKSNRGNSSNSVDTRILFSSLLGSQENWGNETCDRSLYSEQLPFCSPFQNGDQQIYQSLYSSRYVDHQTGPFGCLFPYPNFFGFQEISTICLEQQGLPISGGPVWPGGCTTGFYSGFSDGYSSPAYSVDSSSFLSGRFSSEGI